MENIAKTELIVDATPGSERDDCLFSAAILALKERVPVTLIHNEKKYKIDPHEIIFEMFRTESEKN